MVSDKSCNFAAVKTTIRIKTMKATREKVVKLTEAFINRLVGKIADNSVPNNTEFDFYKRHIILSSCTPDYVHVNVTFCGQDGETPVCFSDTLIQFSFDFRTWEIVYEYGNYDYSKVLKQAFERIYSSPFQKVTMKDVFN